MLAHESEPTKWTLKSSFDSLYNFSPNYSFSYKVDNDVCWKMLVQLFTEVFACFCEFWHILCTSQIISLY